MNCARRPPRRTFEDLLAHLPPDAGLASLRQLFGYRTDREYFRGPRGRLFHPRATGFNLPNARWLCEAAWLAYEDDREKIARSLRHAGFDRIAILGEPLVLIVARRRADLFVLFPGTDPLRLNSWLVNIDARTLPVPGTGFSVHRGYLRHLLRIERDFALARNLAGHGGRVWMSGHSQGGAIATLAAFFYSMVSRVVPPERICVHAFGAPGALFPVSGIDAPFRLYRITNGLDPVVAFPDRAKRPRAGRSIHIDEAGALYVDREQPEGRIFTPGAALRHAARGRGRASLAAAFLSPLLDHALIGYASRLKNAVLPPGRPD